jgi:hypothetical protein
MRNFMLAFNIELNEIVINDYQEGVFYSKLVCTSANDTIEIDSRTSDALAMAVRFGCPIYTYEEILSNAGVTPDNNNKENKPASITSETGKGKDDLSSMKTDELKDMLEEVLEQEDYIKAISIRDELKKRGSNNS